MIRNLSELVAAHPLFAGLPEDVPALVSGCARTVAFAPQRYLLREGGAADRLYLIRRGEIALEMARPGGSPLLIETLGPGAALGWSWLVPPYQWHLDARARSTVLAIAIDADCLRMHAADHPEFGYPLLQRIACVMLSRLQATRIRLLDLYGAAVP